MLKTALITTALILSITGCQNYHPERRTTQAVYHDDATLDTVLAMGSQLIVDGLTAGKDYDEIWIRDFNTFVTQTCDLNGPQTARTCLITFLQVQEEDGNIADGFKRKGQSTFYEGYHKIHPNRPDTVYYKNTVESDQESSLVQAVYKFITHTNDTSILNEDVFGETALARLENSLKFLLIHRYDSTTGLIWGATTVDWGDVQPENEWAVSLDEDSHRAIDIYDNAMFLIAIDNFIEMESDPEKQAHWRSIHKDLHTNIRKHLWDTERQKFIPHLYLDGSPFPEDFDESQISYHGGTAIAIEAGLLSTEEILASYKQMKKNVSIAAAQSIGLTVYPIYPEGYFALDLMKPYSYQNGGDWTWFGARMASQLARNGFAEEAWEASQPMFDRVIENNGFYEWYTISGDPMGSGGFRGSAGVLMTLVEDLRQAQ